MKGRKSIAVMGAALLTLATTMTVFAGSWKQDNVGWWYQRDNGSYPANGWEWIDGNNDGSAECYYFNDVGYMLANTTTPDGYQVDSNGAWISNGIIQTKAVAVSEQAGTSAETVTNQKQIRHLENFDVSNNVLTKVQQQWVYAWNSAQQFNEFKKSVGKNTYASTYDWLAAYADYCDDGALWATLIDRYAIPYNCLDDVPPEGKTLSFSTPTGIGTRELGLYQAALYFIWYINEDVTRNSGEYWSIKYDKNPERLYIPQITFWP